MTTRPPSPWQQTPPSSTRILSAISRISAVLRTGVWQFATLEGLNPTQVDILDMLNLRQEGVRVSWIAEQLGVSAASASDSIASLAEKGLVEKQKSARDGRAVALRLTDAGRALSARINESLAFASQAVDAMPANVQSELFKSLLALIGALQAMDKFPEIRACITCQHFAPRVRSDEATAHHCLLVNAPLPTSLLRLDCAEHLPAGAALAARNLKMMMAA